MECYICGNKAEILAEAFDGDAIRCSSCGDYEISGTLPNTAPWQNASVSQRLRALQNAVSETSPGKRPKITSYSL